MLTRTAEGKGCVRHAIARRVCNALDCASRADVNVIFDFITSRRQQLPTTAGESCVHAASSLPLIRFYGDKLGRIRLCVWLPWEKSDGGYILEEPFLLPGAEDPASGQVPSYHQRLGPKLLSGGCTRHWPGITSHAKIIFQGKFLGSPVPHSNMLI